MKRRSVGVTIAICVLAGMWWVGESDAEIGGITQKADTAALSQPVVLELFTKGCGGPHATCRFFPLKDTEGRRSGTIARGSQPLLDVDGNVVGRHRVFCTGAWGTGWFCSRIETIKPGLHTQRGTITVTGVFRPSAGGAGDPSKFDIFAVTGGSGAYSNVTGYATESWDPSREAFAHTYYLIP